MGETRNVTEFSWGNFLETSLLVDWRDRWEDKIKTYPNKLDCTG